MRFFTNSPRRCLMGVSSGSRGRPRSRCICRVHVHHRPPSTDLRRGLVYGTYVYDRCRCIQWHSPSYTLGNRPDTSDRHCKRRVKAADALDDCWRGSLQPILYLITCTPGLGRLHRNHYGWKMKVLLDLSPMPNPSQNN